ncbi:DUF6538 domain-containing protein [Terasakiella sp. SH-1]|uniref:DUF6538 domain-containing protein n=1 Tax=Terasakiella sp. SH-1 TaxID=2560057 RepID=UPI0010731888|nr:DUF6538 domain-containing protein [Terasakiella sp. SH-1]
MRRFSGLHRRGDIWHYRRWVPLHLRERVGRTEITKSLHTADYSTAKQRYRTVIDHVDQLLQQASEQRLNDDYDCSGLLQEFATVKAPPTSDQDGLRTLIKTVVEEVLEKHSPKKPSITLDDLYHRYMDDPARQRSRKTVMTYQSVYNVLMDIFGKDRLIEEIKRDDCRQFMDVVRHLPA